MITGMFLKWYVIILLGTTVGGWFAYPYAYPVIAETIKRGNLPKIDWDRLKPGSLAPGYESSGGYEEVGLTSGGKRMKKLAPNDRRFDGVVMIEGSAHRSTGFIIKPEDTYFIVTSQHALAGNRKLTIRDAKGRTLRGKNMRAAMLEDIVMMEIDSPPAGLPFFRVASDVDRTAKLQDEIMIAGDGEGTGVVKLTVGRLQAIESVILEVNNDILSALRGGPLFHPGSGTVIGVLAEATKSSMGAAVRGVPGRSSDGTSTEGILYFGHRIDKIDKWQPLDWSDFHEASVAAQRAKSELQMVAAFLSGDGGYSRLKELKVAEEKAAMTLANRSLSKRDRQKAVEELLRVARSIAERRVLQLKNTKMYFIHRQDMKDLKALAKQVKDDLTLAEEEGEGFVKRHGLRWY